MAGKKGAGVDISGEKYVKWLSELNSKSGSVVGGKGANLAEMYNAGFPVPPAFCITAQAFDAFITLSGVKQKIREIIEKTNIDNTLELEQNAKKVREIVENADMPEEMRQEIIEAYDILSGGEELKKSVQMHTLSRGAADILLTSKEPVFVAVRSSATTEDLSTASFAGQQETYTNIKGNQELIHAVKKCFASLYTARAVYYRHKKGFKEGEALLSVVVQRMINSEKSGVVFTKNPMTGANEVVIEAVFGLGEGIVSGKIKPDQYIVSPEIEITSIKISEKRTAIVRMASGEEKVVKLTEEKGKQQVLSEKEIKILANTVLKIEEHYKKPQDIEFAVESGRIYIVQSRPITTLEKEVIKKKQVISGNVLLTGLAASPGASSGIVKIIKTMADLPKIKQGDVLVTKMTNPDMVVTMQRAAAIITDEGGATAHAAIVSREMGIPCVVGTENATQKLQDGMMVTVDGTNGKVYEGSAIEGIGAGADGGKKEILPIVKGTQTKIKVMVDLPDFAERAAKSGCDAVGLVRLEGIIAESGKHPLYFTKDGNINEYSQIIEEGISKIAKHFKEIWVRTSDIRSDEYKNLLGAPKEVEVNPMLGNHGIRFSLKNLQIFKAELGALQRVAEKNPEKKFGIMFPQVISEKEMEEAYKIFKNYQSEKGNLIIGAMIETPASTANPVIRAICKYAKFISFGTNDLTQYTLAIDRGNADVQYMYDEMHPAVLSQLKRVIGVCKEYNVESSICGQAGSKKEMVEFLVRQGIDSVSTNADMAHDISKFVKELESRIEIEKKKNINPIFSENNMANNSKNSKILPVDDLREVRKIGKNEQEKVKRNKEEKEKQQEGERTEVTQEKAEKPEEAKEEKKESGEEKSEEKKQEEFPHFEINFDPFAEQKG